ncbi:MAG: hypothetical protein HQ515_04145, partial [Phycisphaeraceae bacterium]|nr:hypothetical protein [Phycisphaeraceae bacterium]
ATVTVGTLSGFVATETVTATADGTFDSKNVGPRTATAAYTLADGTNDGLATNYSLAGTTGHAATINAKAVDLTGSRVYDGTVNVANGDLEIDELVGDETLALSGIGTVANKNVGIDKALTLGTLALGDGTEGGVASNYTFTGGTQTVDITAKSLTAVYTASNKPYDGTTDAEVSGGSGDVIEGDLITFSESAAFADESMGTDKTVYISDITLGGDDSLNYSLASRVATAAADIVEALSEIVASMISGSGGQSTPLGNTLEVAVSVPTNPLNAPSVISASIFDPNDG